MFIPLSGGACGGPDSTATGPTGGQPGVDAPEETAAGDAFLDAGRAPGGVTDGSDDARAVLRAANRATPEELGAAAAVGLGANARAALIAYRSGPDGAWGTADDRTIGSLAELDSIPWVGAHSYARLLAWGRAQGYAVPRACVATAPRQTPVAALEVAPDDGSAPVVALLAGARRTVDIVVYELSSKEVLAAIQAAAQRHVRVRVILDGKQSQNAGIVTQLQGMGAQARLSGPGFTYTHQKTVVVDGRTAFVFTGNLDYLSLRSGRNFGVFDTAWQDIDDLGVLFEADWAATPAALDCTRLVVAPDNARGRVLDVIAAAQHTLDVQALYITDTTVADALIAAKTRGVAVRVLINDPSFGFGTDETGKRLVAAGVAARRTGSEFVHAKVLIADGARVYLGSENFSVNSLLDNREAGVVLGSGEVDLGRVAAAFESDWARAVSF
jgi:phosphatidylserine/phosphatidylglycerophosphate/cardiolipin synthase-like enzyme